MHGEDRVKFHYYSKLLYSISDNDRIDVHDLKALVT